MVTFCQSTVVSGPSKSTLTPQACLVCIYACLLHPIEIDLIIMDLDGKTRMTLNQMSWRQIQPHMHEWPITQSDCWLASLLAPDTNPTSNPLGHRSSTSALPADITIKISWHQALVALDSVQRQDRSLTVFVPRRISIGGKRCLTHVLFRVGLST